MTPSHSYTLAGVLLAACASTAFAQSGETRSRPAPVIPTDAYTAAVARGTRARSGAPGPRYWQQRAEYVIRATLDPAARRVSGRETIRYHNNSPAALDSVAVQLSQNLYKPGATRNRVTSETEGVVLTRVAVDGATLAPAGSGAPGQPGYRVAGTVGWLELPHPIAPGKTATLEFDWWFTVPRAPSPRMGTDDTVFVVGYWYPQMAVYDDVDGWQVDPYLGNGEFYMDYGDYDVALTVPEGWLVGATGTLRNPEAVLSRQTRDRLSRVGRTRDVVHVVARDDRRPGVSTARGTSGVLTWRFTAENVRDFAWGTSAAYIWDAARASVPAGRGRGAATALVSAFYRPDTAVWEHAAAQTRHAVEYFSRYLWPYPYPAMNSMEGVAHGMEYPMFAAITGAADTVDLANVIEHETGHMWFPMQVGSDERRRAWMDEGFTQYNGREGVRDRYPSVAPDSYVESYLRVARAGGESPSMTYADQYPSKSAAYVAATYLKPATALRALRGILGDGVFLDAFRTYGRRWQYKHPQAWDFFHTVDDVVARRVPVRARGWQRRPANLDWFWRTWFYETWVLDQAIGEVKVSGKDLVVRVDDRGNAPMPVRLAVTRKGGAVERVTLPVDPWLAGARSQTVRVRDAATVAAVAIDPERLFPDADRTNQEWTAPGTAAAP